MDDRRAVFLSLFGDVCMHARTARLVVSVDLRDGSTRRGIPVRVEPADDGEVDDTGYGDHVAVDGHMLHLTDVVSFSVEAPAA